MSTGFMIPPALISVIILSVGALIVLLFTTPLTRNTHWLATLGTLTLLVAALPSLRADGATLTATLTVVAAGIVGMLLLHSVEIEEPSQKPEIAALLLLGSAGGIVFATAPDLLSAVIGLETLSLSGATLVALSRGVRPLEAAFKYFVLAAISAAVLLFGVGLVFMATGSFAWPTLASAPPAYQWLLLAGILLVGLGFAYELALVPLHFGSVDAYTAGALAVTGFVMAASKVAAVIALSRLIASMSQDIPAGVIAAALVGADRHRPALDRPGHARGTGPDRAPATAGVFGRRQCRLPGAGARLRRRWTGRRDLLRGDLRHDGAAGVRRAIWPRH